MATLRWFEEIEAWQRARILTRAVYECSRSRDFYRDFGLRDQIRRAAVSVMSNIAEGFERGGKKEFLQFLAISKASVAEVEAQLYVALDQSYITDDQFATLKELTGSTKKLIGGFMRYLRQSDIQGSKYK